ncbi:PspA/IM30 family protein [Paraliomyxa miuraensis]|uniref:PspA/IM30 family protein n=1 Tax=Paraliomyxa miuraensis TaxID=376150 RepID=UPI00224F5452|nr:PspA/IM30 family protein [Paraliomyxa miuraensis]MCX4239819.1 PspA/IM30 family protein [Paraliomyxa miuraensis]
MSNKPGLFSRLKNSISSALNDAVDAVSDPGQEVALMIDDLGTQIQESERDLKQAIVDRKMLERKITELEAAEKQWVGKAEQALRLGDEELARAALARKGDYALQLVDARAGLQQQVELADTMARQIKEAKAKHKSLNLRRGSLMAQARAAKKGVAPGTLGDGGTLSRLDDIENKISRLEALNEVNAELSGTTAEDAAVDARLAQLEAGSGLDDELEKLKAKMGQKSLPKGEDE